MPRPLLLIIYAAVAVLAAIAAFKYVLPILLPFIIALIIVLFMEPIIKILQQRVKMPRGFAVLAAMVLVFGSIGVVLTAVIIRLVSELIQISVSLPGLSVEIRNYILVMIEKITAFYVTLPPAVTTSLEQNINNLASSLQGMASMVANFLMSFISMLPGTFLSLIH